MPSKDDPSTNGKDASGDDEKEEQPPPKGGYDDTPMPHAEPGFTVKITFHRAKNLPVADYGTMSSDPYVLAMMNVDSPKRHKEDSPILFRTPTIQKTLEPEWNCEWVVANIPSSGFHLKARVYDEDSSDTDDRLGNAHIDIPSMSENFQDINCQPYTIMKRSGSWRAYAVRGIAKAIDKDVAMRGDLYVSIELLGRTEAKTGKVFTVGPGHWSQHFSPLIGRMTGTKGGDQEDGRVEKYDFQANQMQLAGPVPDELYHRYVEFKPFVKGMFSKTGIRGNILNRLLHRQHAKLYQFDKNTRYGCVAEPGKDVAQQFLDLVHYAEGARMFTYVLMLDGQLRFTETGKSFGIDMLSKHTMHSDVSQYIAYSGEFFIRRAGKTDRLAPPSPPPNDRSNSGKSTSSRNSQGKPAPPKDSSFYELVIDNDSGTYRPNKDLLPKLQKFLEFNFEGLTVIAKACDDESHIQAKKDQRELRKAIGDKRVYAQVAHHDEGDSVSSSDESDLMRREEELEEEGRLHKVKEAITSPKSSVLGWASKAA